MDETPRSAVDYASDETAAVLIRRANRILVVGSSGGGKSTLSRKIAARFDLPYVSMDREFFWLPGWVARDRAEQRSMIAARVTEDRWIMDGSNPSSFDIRLPRTDIVIWVRLPRLLCLWGIFSRSIRTFGRTRPDMAPGCPEKLPDREFVSYVWNFEERHAPIFIRNFERYGRGVPVLVLKSRRQMRHLLDLLDREA
ncbi:ATPase AAA [Rhizobium sp. LC145]|uniref:ATPase AAA n=1 Tax=Rhizobium sp. LC145 TaxID=1120688 RepID=UPI00062A11DD|nr:ATPase AAA [Rhizobium sp. LC145]KKX33685.1 ATPase AAA [Rhizobium sp. LC145]TKT55351.1 AAA family ATPase [Rhizobiaceae bacterium LC148]